MSVQKVKVQKQGDSRGLYMKQLNTKSLNGCQTESIP